MSKKSEASEITVQNNERKPYYLLSKDIIIHLKDILLSKPLKYFYFSTCFCVTYIAIFILSGRNVPSLDLDNSWQVVLEYAVEHQFQFGKDIVFNYGPLGFIATLVSQGHLIGQRIFFALLLSLIIAASVTWFISKINGFPRYLFLIWFFVFVTDIDILGPAFDIYLFDIYLSLAMICGTIFLIDEDCKQIWVTPLIIANFALFSFIKFTYFLAACVSLTLCILLKSVEKKFVEAVYIVTCSILFILLFWKALGQEIVNFPRWIYGSLELTFGHVQAMSKLPLPGVFLFAIIASLLYIVAVVFIIYKSKLNMKSLIFLLALLFFTFLLWKEGFTRADGHVVLYLCFLPLAFCIMFIRTSWFSIQPSKLLISLIVGTILCCLLAINSQYNGFVLNSVNYLPVSIYSKTKSAWYAISGKGKSLFPDYEQLNDYRRAAMLPTTQKIVGNHPVDVMNYLQWAAVANGMNYQPRPVFQGYLAYTPYLQELNKAYLKRLDSPNYILFCHQSIDKRFPTINDSASFNYVLCNYVPVESENGFILMHKILTKEFVFQPIHEQTLQFGEQLDITRWNKDLIFISVSMKPTVLGRVITFLFQQFPIGMNCYVGDSVGSLQFVPIMGNLPFLLNPLILNNDDILYMYKGTPRFPIQKISFEILNQNLPSQWEDSIVVKLYKAQRVK